MSRFYFRRKTGYMSPYTLRSVIRTIRSSRRRGFPIAALYIRIGRRAYLIRKGEHS